MSCLRSCEIPAIILLVSIAIPKKVSCVEGPSIFEVLTGALLHLHRETIACRLSEHSVEHGEPAVKKSFK